MKVFVTGTDTNVGKTIISAWICYHTNCRYWKPIQTGSEGNTDSEFIRSVRGSYTYPESYSYKKAVSPHLAAKLEGTAININKICLPKYKNLVVEGAGGVLVPINDNNFMVDLIKFLNLPVILVSRSCLGTINHTLLTLEILNSKKINVLAVVMNGIVDIDNQEAIKFYSNILYGKKLIIIQFPKLVDVTSKILKNISLPAYLQNMFKD